MSLQVRGFEYETKQNQILWKFKLGESNTLSKDFYSYQQSIRSLYNLCQDISLQIQTQIQKNNENKNYSRNIRKISENIIKVMGISIQQFCGQIEEQIQNVKLYFRKKLQQQILEKLQYKIVKWILIKWLSINPELLFTTTNKYINSYIRDSKKIIPNIQMHNEIYKFQNISYSNNYVLIDVNFTIQDKYFSQSFLWNPQNTFNFHYNLFVNEFLKDILGRNNLIIGKQLFQDILSQIIIQIKTQITYKIMLQKYSSIILNYSTIQIPSQLRQYNIPISIKLIENNIKIYQDYFQWDILNDKNNVQQFCRYLIKDNNIPSKYLSQLCYKIRTQINSELQWKYTLLVKTYKQIHKDRQSPKLNTQTIGILRKNINYSMNVTLPLDNYTYNINNQAYFNNSDLFSLLSRNNQILSQQIQNIHMLKGNKQQNKLNYNYHKINQYLQINKYKIQQNQYINGIVHPYIANKIWNKKIN